MQTEIYTLPEITFVGGETQTLRFNLKDENGEYAEVGNCVVSFSVTKFSDQSGVSVIEMDSSTNPQNVEIASSEDGFGKMIVVNIPPNTTVNMVGKYVYQITIKTLNDGKTRYEIPRHGIINVIRNIDASFISISE